MVNESKGLEFVKGIFKQMPASLTFHNWQHTAEVVETVTKIGQYLELSIQQLNLVRIAGLFHDTGYLYDYHHHEDFSMSIARKFLMEQEEDQFSKKTIEECIAATKIPQNPNGLLAEILCDADLAHFASPNYPLYAARLRKEWSVWLNKYYDDREWLLENLSVMQSHRYKTAYGNLYLQPLKEKTIDYLEKQLLLSKGD